MLILNSRITDAQRLTSSSTKPRCLRKGARGVPVTLW